MLQCPSIMFVFILNDITLMLVSVSFLYADNIIQEHVTMRSYSKSIKKYIETTKKAAVREPSISKGTDMCGCVTAH